jgi:hypothetical protein
MCSYGYLKDPMLTSCDRSMFMTHAIALAIIGGS